MMNKWMLILGCFITSANSQPTQLLDDDRVSWAGTLVDAGDGWAFVGDALLDNGSTAETGGVYVYRRLGEQWHHKQTLFAEDAQTLDRFGYALAYDEGTLAVGAYLDDVLIEGVDYVAAGSVTTYGLNDQGQWVQTGQLTAPEPTSQRGFGTQIDVHNNEMIIADFGSGEDFSEQVHFYHYEEGQWTLQQTISNDGSVANSRMGADVLKLSEEHAFINRTIQNHKGFIVLGQVLVYEKTADGWYQSAVIDSPAEDFNVFGTSLDYRDGTLVVSSMWGNNAEGEVFIFEQTNHQWLATQHLYLESGVYGAQFGRSVVLGDDQLYISRRYDEETALEKYRGAVYAYDLIAGQWSLSGRYDSGSIYYSDGFGGSLAIDNQQLIVGATNRASAYAITVEPNPHRFKLNAGLNGNWYNPETAGQGLFFDIREALNYAFMGWFTYDIETDTAAGEIGHAGQRWLVGNGTISQTTRSISFDLFYAAGGLFDDSQQVVGPEVESYGSLTVVFDSCDQAQVTYQIPSENLSGSFSVTRPLNGTSGICQAYADITLNRSSDAFDVTLNGHWFNPETTGQGLFVDQFYATDQAFLGWFTFDTESSVEPDEATVGANGQRWLVGTGQVDAGDPAVLNYQLYYTAGGLFDDAEPVTVEGAEGYGTLRLEFLDCANAMASYELTTSGISGQFELVKLLTDADNPDCSAPALSP